MKDNLMVEVDRGAIYDQVLFERTLVKSYQDFCLNWKDYLVPADIQHFDASGSIYHSYGFEEFMRYLNAKHNRTKFYKHDR